MAEAKQVDFLVAGIRHPLTDEPLAGGLVYTYAAGTSTLANLYVDRDTAEGNATNPVVLDSFGRAEVFGNGVYKFVIKDAAEAETILEMDNMEYYAVISDTAIPPLTADLDFNGNRGKNLPPGTAVGHTVEYAQFRGAIDTLETAAGVLGGRVSVTESDINAVKAQMTTRLTTAESDIGAVKARMTTAESDIGAVKARMTTAESDIDTLQSDVDAVEDAVAGLSYAFTDLTDTPATLVGQATKIPRVNAGGTALEFYTPAQLLATGAFLNLSDTPADYTGQQGKAPVVNAGATALEFAFPDARTLYGIAISATTPADGQVLAYDSALNVYKPVNQTSIPSLATLTPGTGITGDPYDGTVARTWTVATRGVTLAETSSDTYTAPTDKTILAAAAIGSNGVTSTLILPTASINAGVLNVLIYVDYQTRVYHQYTYTTGKANSISVAPTHSGNDIVRVMVLLCVA